MQFIVNSNELSSNLQALYSIIDSSTTIPILKDFLFEINKNNLIVTASDINTTMITNINITSKEKFKVAVPSKILMESLKTMPNQPLTFNIDKENFAIEITSDYGKYKIPGENADLFPNFPELEEEKEINISGEILSRAINKTIFAVSDDDARKVLTGIYFEFEDGKTNFVGTDAHRLVVFSRKDIINKNGKNIVLPTKPLSLLKNLLSNYEEDVKIKYSSNNILFSFANIKLITRLIDGIFPNYKTVLNEKKPYKLIIDRKLFLGTLKRVIPFASKTNYMTIFKITGNTLNIKTIDYELQTEAEETLKCQYEGKDLKIAFNARSLIEIIENIDAENVLFTLPPSSELSTIIYPDDKVDDKEELVMLLMPLSLEG